MPIYEYIASGEGGCRVCRAGFPLRRPVERPALEVCPLCKGPVRKVISTFSTPKVAKPFSVSEAKAAGFTILERRDKGTYEKL